MIPIIDSILGVVNKFIPDPDKAREAAVKLEAEYTKQMELQASIIKTEASQGGISAKWRPWTMIAFVAMVVIHWTMYDVIPFLIVTFNWNLYYPQDPGLTSGLLDVINLGLGGYIGGRTVEKVASIWKGK